MLLELNTRVAILDPYLLQVYESYTQPYAQSWGDIYIGL